MSRGKQVLLLASRAGMEISWRWACAGYLMLLTIGRGFPLAAAAAALAVSALVRHWPVKGNWRLYQALLLRLLSFVTLNLLVAHRIWYRGAPLLSTAWLLHAVSGSPDAPPQYALVLAIAGTWLIWRGGRALVGEAHREVPFDRGIGTFLLLLLVQLFAGLQAEELAPDRVSIFLVPAFYLFSLIAMGLVQDRDEAQRSFRAGYRGLGALLAVSVLGVAFASAATLLLYPQLAGLADSLQGELRAVGRPLGSVLTRILLWLFSPRRLSGAPADPAGAGQNMPELPEAPQSEAGLVITRILSVVLVGVTALVLLGLLFHALRALVRLLGKRYGPERRRAAGLPRLRVLLRRLARLPAALGRLLRGLLRGIDHAGSVYRGLLRWGRASGLPAAASETPSEYGMRIAGRFPKLRREIRCIVETFNREAYGEMPTGPQRLARILRARRSLRSPRHWPSRLRVLLRG